MQLPLPAMTATRTGLPIPPLTTKTQASYMKKMASQTLDNRKGRSVISQKRQTNEISHTMATGYYLERFSRLPKRAISLHELRIQGGQGNQKPQGEVSERRALYMPMTPKRPHLLPKSLNSSLPPGHLHSGVSGYKTKSILSPPPLALTLSSRPHLPTSTPSHPVTDHIQSLLLPNYH